MIFKLLTTRCTLLVNRCIYHAGKPGEPRPGFSSLRYYSFLYQRSCASPRGVSLFRHATTSRPDIGRDHPTRKLDNFPQVTRH